MVATQYSFNITGSFPNAAVDTGKLSTEILGDPNILIALSDVNLSGSFCNAVFKDALSLSGSAALDALVAAHDGVPEPDPTTSDNRPIVALSAEQADKAIRVVIDGRTGSEFIRATHNFCDKTSWFTQATQVTSGTLHDSGDGLTFSASNMCWTDTTHGKVLEEDKLSTDYGVAVRVDGVEKVQKNKHWGTTGDYTVDYCSGTVTFDSSVTGSVDADFWHSSGSAWYLEPAEGKVLHLEDAEAQFSEDVLMHTGICFIVEGYAAVFAPQLGLPAGTRIPIMETKYRTFAQIIDESRGAYPLIPAIGGVRGLSSNVYGFPFNYSTVRSLQHAYGMRLRVELEDPDKVFGGSRATATFYCVSKDE